MDAVWSREFVVAVVCFVTPVALAAGLVYRRVLKSDLRRRRRPQKVTVGGVAAPARTQTAPVVKPDTPEATPAVAAAPEPSAAAKQAGPVKRESLEESLENLRQSLLEFRSSIQHSRNALGELQACDCRFSMDLNRASEVMEHAFPE